MNATVWAGQLAAPLAVAAGIFICFCGYRILKLTLGITGFILGAAAGWSFGLSVAPDNSAIALVCAVIAGAISAALCIWLFFLGIFLLGAGTGAIVGAALFSMAGNQVQPILLLACALLLGVIALVLQKFMIIVSTSFSGSYLIAGGILCLLTGVRNGSPLWFDRLQPGSAGIPDYIALAFWLLLGLAGVSFQYKSSLTREGAARHETQAARSGG